MGAACALPTNVKNAASAMAIPGRSSQFEDVFAEPTWMLEEQEERLLSEQSEDAS